MFADPYATQVLDRTVHARLVADIDTFAQDARIQPENIWTPLAEKCGTDEINYVKRFKFHKGDDVAGLVYVGKIADADIDGRMAAMAGALIRNFVRARVMVLSQLLDSMEDEGVPDISALLIPNFHTPATAGGTKSPWRSSNLLDVLVYRRTLGVQTIVAVSDFETVGAEYGMAVRRLLKHNYVAVKV